MNDLGTFLGLLKKANVEFKQQPHVKVREHIPKDMENVAIDVDVQNSLDGYCGFYGVWHFDAVGNILGVSHWE